MLSALDSALRIFRGALLGVAAVLTAVCLADWLVRTRRVNAFGPVARFLRSYVDPLIRPVERRVVRAGGLPSSAPWGALALAVLGGILIITVIEFVRAQAAFLMLALDRGPGGLVRVLVGWAVSVLQLAIIVRVLVSWLSALPGRWYVRWSFKLSEPLLRPLRQIIPTVGTMDLTPIIAWFVLGLLRDTLLSLT